MQAQLPAPTAEGSFGKTPFAHLLVYALERRLSGSFLIGPGAASLVVVTGCPAKLALTGAEGAGDAAQVASDLATLFDLPPDTTYAYYDAIDVLSARGVATPIDPLPVLWRGVKSAPARDHVEATMRRVGATGVRIATSVQAERLGLDGPETQLFDMLRQGPVRVQDLAGLNIVDPETVQLLVYFLIITKQVELVDVGTAAPPPGAPVNVPAAPASSASIGRVQLQARPVARTPVVVEEMAASPADDERASIPGTPAPGAASAGGLTAEQNALKAKILERADQITAQNYFEMLGLDQAATPEAVQKAFIALAKVWHPDRLPPVLSEVKDACSKVFAHITEAHATLSDPKKRQEYMTLVKDGGATPDDQAKIQTILEASTEFQKAEILMKRNPADPKVLEHARRAFTLDPEQVEYMALCAWIESQRPESQARDKTLEKIAILDKCIQKNPRCERAYFYRAMLHKRVEDSKKAIADFKIVVDLNPKNLDAAREVRLYRMRGGSKPPPAEPSSEPKGGLLGKLFKK